MIRFLLLVGFSLLLVACGPKISGNDWSHVTIRTDATDTKLYLVPLTDWNAMQKQGVPRNASTLADYCKASGTNAIEVKGVKTYKQVVVVERGGKTEYREFTPVWPKSEVTVPSPK